MDDLIGEFISETSESLAALERALGEHARQPMTRDGWDMASRLMHTIKGTCGFLRFTNMEDVAAQSEQLLAALRDGNSTPSAEQLTALRSKMAQISYMMDYLAREGAEPTLLPLVPFAPPDAAELEELPSASPPPTPPPSPSVVAVQEQLREQLHRSPVEAPALPLAPTALAVRASQPQTEERVSYATLATLMKVRNQLKHSLGKGDANVKALEKVLTELKGKLLERPAGPMAFPRPGEMVLVASGTMRFAIEQLSVREIVRIHPDQRLAKVGEGAMISLRGSWLPRLSLAHILGQSSGEEEAYAMVMDTEEGRFALCVERIEGIEQLMLQAVPRLLRASRIYRAAAILGDGSPCLALDVEQLLCAPVQTAPAADTAEPVTPAATHPAGIQQSLLLFSDGTPSQKAVLLSQVVRVEPLPHEMVHQQGASLTATCRGELLHLHLLPGSSMPSQGDVHAILLQGAPGHALVAHRMGGIVEWPLGLVAHSDALVMARRPIGEAMTDIINPTVLLTREASHG